MVGSLLTKRAFWLFCCEGRHRRDGEGKTATGSPYTRKIAGGQGRRHLPNRFHPGVFWLARPKNTCRTFGQLDRFCFPGFGVPKGERHYSGQHSERWRACLRLDVDNRQRVYDKDKAVKQNKLPVRSGRGPGPILRPSLRLRLLYRQTPFLHPDVQQGGYTQGGRLCAETAKELVQNALEEVSKEGEGLFVEQQPKRPWQNLASVLGRCFLLADRRQGEIYIAWESPH